jgi:hypothetical protein
MKQLWERTNRSYGDIREKEEKEVKERERQTKGRNEVRDEDIKEILFFFL